MDTGQDMNIQYQYNATTIKLNKSFNENWVETAYGKSPHTLYEEAVKTKQKIESRF